MVGKTGTFYDGSATGSRCDCLIDPVLNITHTVSMGRCACTAMTTWRLYLIILVRTRLYVSQATMKRAKNTARPVSSSEESYYVSMLITRCGVISSHYSVV